MFDPALLDHPEEFLRVEARHDLDVHAQCERELELRVRGGVVHRAETSVERAVPNPNAAITTSCSAVTSWGAVGLRRIPFGNPVVPEV